MRYYSLIPLIPLTLMAAEKWTVDDILFQERISQVELARDGNKLAWVKSQMDREKGTAVSNIVLRYLDDGHEIRLTRGTDGSTSPKFSPDNKFLAFISSRKSTDSATSGGASGGAGGEDPKPQVWLFDLRGGEPSQLTHLTGGVRAFEWVGNDSLLLVAPEDPTLYAQEIKKKKDTSQVVDDELHEPPVRLYRFFIKDSKTRRLTTNIDRITGVSVSPDGKWALTTHNRSLREIYDSKIKSTYWLHDLTSGASSQIFADGKLRPRRPVFTPDSAGFYFNTPHSNHPMYDDAAVNLLYYFDLQSKSATAVELDWSNGTQGALEATDDGFLVLLANGARPKAARYTRSGNSWTRQWLEGSNALNIVDFTLSLNGQVFAYEYSTASEPGGWFTAKLEGSRIVDPKPAAGVNGGWASKPKAKSELVYWNGARDEKVEGILYYPHNYVAGKSYPLVVMIHGGPHGVDTDSFGESMAYPVQLHAQRGAFILRPNYHGSSGYGLAWGESITGGNYNDLEWIDVEKGVDSLIAKGLVDKDKLGVMGWSNGSIITIELTTRTTRYKVAGAGAGDVNWISDWGNAVFGDSFDNYYFGRRPMDDPEFYVKKSPLFRMDKVRTPTIIFFGTEDRQVPTEQGWQHYQALKHYGNTDVKFILFPGEAHGPRKLVHQRRKLEEELAWFDKYLYGTATEKNEALKPGSPLDAALQRAKLGRYPEVVYQGKFAIGRFEVTRAQFAVFDPDYKFPAGTGNYPASGMSFDRAKAYCDWLSKQTGLKYRLGTEKEMSKLLAAKASENTLDSWVGYTLNVDDAGKVASLVAGLGEGALLKPVGSYPGTGDDPVYDLGGNAAEWVISEDGTGKALGGSAERPADSKAETAAKPDYIGFRVVRDQN